MHVVPFTFKRAHFACFKILQAIAAREGLTPARFDVLFVLHANRHRRVPVTYLSVQKYVACRLGVSRATVCKLVRALRLLGILEQRPYETDRRYKILSLTRYGRRTFRRVMRVLRRGHVNAAIRRAYKGLGASRIEISDLTFEMVDRIRRFSRGVGEFTLLYNHPRTAPEARIVKAIAALAKRSPPPPQ